jgi:acyl-CoA synthetase (AMP-forming)/AMP-acid ligase II
MGEVMFRGNITMKGYLKNPAATQEAFRGRLVPHRRPGVMLPGRLREDQGPRKDIIISGGENISSIEVEDVLYRHPAVMAAAVVAKPDPKWGETPCAFIELKAGASVTAAEIVDHCRKHLAGVQGAARGGVRGVAEDVDGEDPEVEVDPGIMAGVSRASKVQTGGQGGNFVWPALIRKLDRVDPSYKT